MIILISSTLYVSGEPFARFASNLSAALWLQSVGCRFVARSGSRMIFKLN